MTYEGLRDWVGRECKPLVSFRENKWEFGGLEAPDLAGFEFDIGKIKSESKNLQKISDLVSVLDTLQLTECQKRKKWHKRLDKETDQSIRLEITRRLLDSEDRAYESVLEIIRLLKGAKSVIEKTDVTLESNKLDSQLDELMTSL